MEINPRKEEVNTFLEELEGVMGLLAKKQQQLNGSIGNAFEVYQEEEARV